jgi:formylglycine-generating enzyme required for sulfatase activity
MNEPIGPGTRIGEYILREKIGEGGFGSVWKAVHHVWEDRVAAVKVPTDPRLIDQLRREAEIQHALEKLDDEHILRTIGLDTSHDPPYFVMEYVPGESLRALLARKGRLGLDAVLEYAEQILLALAHAHGAGVIHRDLKPENVLVTAKGSLKIMDFGLGFRPEKSGALLLSGDLEGAAEGAEGTLEYMAPEMRAGEPAAPGNDLYSFGVILFEMLAGERPQPGDRLADLNPAVPAALERIFEKCYTRAQKRYASAGEVLTDLRRLREPTAPAAPRETPKNLLFGPPPGMVLVPAGSFTLGSDSPGEDRSPAHARFLEDFFVEATPVTNAAFLRFIREKGYEEPFFWAEGWDRVGQFLDSTGRPGPRSWARGMFPSGRDLHPVVGVSWFECCAYARWAGLRLPAEEEWEKAARGPSTNPYPWGADFDPKRCNTSESELRGTTPVSRYKKGASPFGVLDLSGNVLEWTASWFKPYPGHPGKDLRFGETYRVLRGGAWCYKAKAAEVTVRHFLRPELRVDHAGFRCAADAPRKPEAAALPSPGEGSPPRPEASPPEPPNA